MKVNRNDPCPCGSGKKYKKCCLAKDEELAREQASQPFSPEPDEAPAGDTKYDVEAEAKSADDIDDNDDDDDDEYEDDDFADDELEDKPSQPSRKSKTQIEAQEVLWKEFEAADYEGRIALLLKTMDEPKLMDEQLAFDMFDKIYNATWQHDERHRFNKLVGDLRQRLPAVYAENASYYLSWMITNTVATGQWEEADRLAHEMAETADEDIDTFNNAIQMLAYHGRLSTLAAIMRRAWSKVEQSIHVVPWGVDEFYAATLDYIVFDYLEQHPAAEGHDPELLRQAEFHDKLNRKQFADFIAQVTGKIEGHWTMADFDDRFLKRSSKGKAQPAGWQNVIDLSHEFLGYLWRQENVSYPKGEIARKHIVRYLSDRQAGELNESESMLERALRGNRPQRQRRPISPEHVLCPDPETFERYLVKLLHFLNPQFYDVGATFELIPAWLRFLEGRQLIDSDLHRRALLNLGKLHKDLTNLFENYKQDSALAQAMKRWHENARV